MRLNRLHFGYCLFVLFYIQRNTDWSFISLSLDIFLESTFTCFLMGMATCDQRTRKYTFFNLWHKQKFLFEIDSEKAFIFSWPFSSLCHLSFTQTEPVKCLNWFDRHVLFWFWRTFLAASARTMNVYNRCIATRHRSCYLWASRVEVHKTQGHFI